MGDGQTVSVGVNTGCGSWRWVWEEGSCTRVSSDMLG